MLQQIGNSLFDEEGAKIVGDLLARAKSHNVKIVLPVDYVTGDGFSKDAKVGYATDETGIPDGWMGLDIGEKTIESFIETIKDAKTILWNGYAALMLFSFYQDYVLTDWQTPWSF